MNHNKAASCSKKQTFSGTKVKNLNPSGAGPCPLTDTVLGAERAGQGPGLTGN